MASPSKSELHQGEEARPKNNVFITKYEEWKREQKACQRERKVTVLEITNLEGCGIMRPLFVHLVEEFHDVRFIKVLTGDVMGLARDTICQDVGVVEKIPTILLLYYDHPDHIKRKSYEGESAIQCALRYGVLRGNLKDLLHERSQSSDGLRCEDNIREDVHPYNELQIVEIDGDMGYGTLSTRRHSLAFGSLQSSSKASNQPRRRSATTSQIIKRSDIKVVEFIGQGGYGTVHKAMWKEKKVAVKVCTGNILKEKKAAQEVRILASLIPHPNIIAFFGVAVSEDEISSLIVTDLAAGGSLYTRLHGKEREIPTATQRLGWAIQIARGMKHLHYYNVIHRDLKSPNVLLSHGYAKICDFGTARHLSENFVYTGQAGTYRWMAPEVAQESCTEITNKCDVFSYGMILYEIYALELPFSDVTSDARVSCAIMDGKRPSLPEKLPSFLHPLLQDCWDKEPAQRPSFKTIVVTIQTEFYEKENVQ